MISAFLGWLGNTKWSVMLLESFYMWPLLESTHVLLLALFVGTAVMMDLRLIGVAFRNVPASAFTERLLPWTRIGFALMVATGLLLFYSSPLRYYYNLFFRVKVVLLILAGLNVWLFHSRIYLSISEWENELRPPRAARLAGMVSLMLWTGVVFSGRLVAYNWFECELQPQPGWVNVFAGCDVDESAIRDDESPAPPSVAARDVSLIGEAR